MHFTCLAYLNLQVTKDLALLPFENIEWRNMSQISFSFKSKK